MVYSNDGLGCIATYWNIVYWCVVAIFYGWDSFDINTLVIGEVLYGMAGNFGHFLCDWLVVHQVETKIAHDMESTKFQDTEFLNFINWKLRIQWKVAVGGRPAATCWVAVTAPRPASPPPAAGSGAPGGWWGCGWWRGCAALRSWVEGSRGRRAGAGCCAPSRWRRGGDCGHGEARRGNSGRGCRRHGCRCWIFFSHDWFV